MSKITQVDLGDLKEHSVHHKAHDLQLATGDSEPMLAAPGATDHCLSPQGKGHRMTPACPLLLSVILSLRLAAAFDPAPSACSALASGVLYGAFSLQDLFPTIASGCSWTLENPDPTKYSLYLRFNRQEQVCAHFAPRLLPLDHYLVNFTCLRPSPDEAEAQAELGRPEEEEEAAGLELCGGSGPFTFLHFDKNFVQLCLSAEPSEAPRLLAPAALAFRFVEVLLINNNNSSQFTCGVLCRWSEECGRAAGRACGFAQPGCSCPGETGASPATTTPPGPPAAHTLSNALVPGGPALPAEADLHSGSSNDLFTTEMRYGESEQGPGEVGVSGGLMVPILADTGAFMWLFTNVSTGSSLVPVLGSPKWIGVRPPS